MEQLNQVMHLIEKGIDDEIDVAAIARQVYTSEHHLRRMFSALAGMPLSVYVRRRRLTVAAAAVVRGDEAIQDIAVRFGYASADAFSRAFRDVHGVGPEAARRPGAVLQSQPPLTFRLTVQGSTRMEYRIVTKDAFRIVGLTGRFPVQHRGVGPGLEEFTNAITDEQAEALEALSDQEPAGTFSAMTGFDDSRAEGSLYDYWVGAATSSHAPDGFAELEVPAGTWVVFPGPADFPSGLQDLWPRAASEWFPANPYRSVPGPEIAVLHYDDDGEVTGCELWLPVEPT
ncbi:transcriptional regulator, AraC family [Xylanimonas cellulosilytica DSM 15894]|uniref:Transcriptional regulator, AraC family n=1 Tax=Xylanimonas cellulosilytica (strain DSM 15894 / JCM 12276 / CECT 5975 / KCTC 9989 / LMG 20990 / NBRC 107835 / XIL07) TaxID=446471 RepID=D1BYC2_XYLCX|nr:AraC family transcriptional regulator [Xylanimonas cellulosilytica]ACZ31794.1 transcriptional regulator, AraC family [Xylanimonas cellulosilytica DSM 15894]